MVWRIVSSNYNCCYHNGKGDGYCGLLFGHKCEEKGCPMIDKFLKRYLLSHELDIANGFNDFAELQGTFESVVGREPNEEG